MRKTILVLFASLLLLALAGTAGASCISCNSPCEDIYGPNYQCNDDGAGPYGGCTNFDPCRGCHGWFDFDCLNVVELRPAAPAPLLGLQTVSAVVVRTNAPAQSSPVRVAALTR